MTMKERIRETVAQKLAGAVDGEAKEAIIEELSGNLCAKYDDLVAHGADPEEAYEAAVESIGDVSELIELAGGTTGRAEVQKAVDATIAMGKDLAQKLKGPAKEVWGGVKQAAYAAKEPLADMGRTIADAVKNLEITVDVEKSGHQFDYTVPGDDITGLELRLRSGEVVIRLWDEDSIQVIERSARTLDENKHASFLRRADGVLCIEQGNTAAGFVFFTFGVFASDFEVFLPRRLWNSVTVYSASGDITFPEALEVKEVLISSTSGDIDLGEGLTCDSLNITAVSGDVEGKDCACAKVIYRATSGDFDVAFTRLPDMLDVQSVSGDTAITLPADNEGFVVEYHQVSGDLHSDFDLVTSISRHDGVATYKGAVSPKYQVSTVSGDVDIAAG